MLSCLWDDAYKRTLVNNVLSASLNETFPSFHDLDIQQMTKLLKLNYAPSNREI